MQPIEEVPASLREEVEAARAWLDAERGRRFRVTGLLDGEAAVRASGGPHDLTLILCDGDLCAREQVHVRPVAGGFEIRGSEAVPQDPPAEVDPLPGVRRGWLDGVLAQHAFVVLVFYRGFW